jgi:hypothetical protein
MASVSSEFVSNLEKEISKLQGENKRLEEENSKF